MFEWKKFIQDVASVSEGDYSAGFEMLGFEFFVSQCGPKPLLDGVACWPIMICAL
jgi:hypothetical protein